MEKIRPAFLEKEFINEIAEHYKNLQLREDEILCPFCHGTQMIARRNFEHCNHCEDGKMKVCRFCRQPIDRMQGHYCRGMRDEHEKEERRKEQKQLDDAKEISDAECKTEECFYSDLFTENDGFFTTMEDFINDWESSHKGETRPEYVFCTKKDVPYIDASDVVESFILENAYDNARDNLDWDEVKKLQLVLNNFCTKCGVGPTYYKDTLRKAKIPWN